MSVKYFEHRGARLLALLALLLVLCAAGTAHAAISVAGTSYGRNEGLPTDGSPGALTIPRPSGVTPGMALVATIAARPRSMTVVVPAGWQLMTFTDEPDGGTATAPYGMSMITYYKIATTSEPATYTWTFANPSNAGGMVVGAMLAINGIDTASGNPIDNNGAAYSAYINPFGTSFRTGTITTVTPNTIVISSLTYLSAGSFSAPTGISGITESIDISGPAISGSVGITIQMSLARVSGTGTVGPVSADASNDADYGIGHLMAMQPSGIDPTLAVQRNNSLSPGSTASYTMTVNNLGYASEPGPLTIVSTLPTGLTYSSATGSGWGCSLSGQTVTCNRTGALASGATAPLLTMNVTVDGTAAGPLTFNATVSGTGGDANVYNNTAVDTYVVPTAPYAYYALDEAAWGTIADASGNGHTASKLGSASPTGSNVASPPGAAVSGSTGTCGAGTIPAGTGHGIDTGIAVNSLGNAGTIAFWYAGSSIWNDGTSRMLFDASAHNSGSDRHFFLAKDGTGRLVFSFKDGAGTTATVTTSQYGYRANEWHHIAVTWTANGALAITLDGTLAASSSTALNGSMGTLATLYLGAQRSSTMVGTPAAYTANSAYGLVDELRVYGKVLTTEELEAMTAWTHTCTAGIHHYELSTPSTAIACLASTLTVTACTDSSSPCTSKATTLAGQTATLSASAGSLAASTLTFDASGMASTTLSYAAAASGSTVTVSLSGEQALASSARQCCPNGSSCSAANSCSVSFDSAGFIIAASANGSAATLPTATAGTASASYSLRAVKTSTTTKACEAALTGSTTVNWAYQCNNPSTCASGNRLTLTGSGAATAIAANPASGVSSTLPVAMTFDANGNAPFNFTYSDVGQVTLSASKAAGGTLASALAGSSNAFVVRPAGFVLSGIQCASYSAGNCATSALASPGSNPGASTASGTAFLPAGRPFAVTVTAVDSTGAATPNFGRETSPEGVVVSHTLVAPALGIIGSLANASGFGSFSNGVATGSAFSWSEVGVIRLTPSLADGSYLGTGPVTGTASGNVGRFYPHHFDTSVTPACSAVFSYAGQPFNVTVTARNGLATPGTTSNVDNTLGWANAVTLSDGSALGLGAIGGTGVAASTFSGGSGSGSASYSFTSKTTGPQTLVLRASGSDGVSSTGYTEGSTPLRSGRLRLSNAFGAAGALLSVPITVEYWSGQSWVLNSADNCSTLATSAAAISNPRTYQGVASALSAAASTVTLAGGNGSLRLLPATSLGGLTTSVAINLGSGSADQSCNASHPATVGAGLPWLRSSFGNCAASADRDPAALASFGIFSAETRKTVHARDMF
jgi:MSHA biogenesis protein MshQ